ncbi:MAG: Protein-L-isoaspartate O-methyltransferase [Hyphomicrobiales bacterium]|nr:Protein-L-isoaspartate O-methyltransferase [Hyphomicrobiales bacterium]
MNRLTRKSMNGGLIYVRNERLMVDFNRARKMMVETQLRTSNVTDRRLLAVMGQVPRERFVPARRKELAYIDEVHPLETRGAPRYLSAPAPFAKLLQLAEVKTADKVLDLGCGSGYSAAVLAGLAASVVAVESDAELVVRARDTLAELNIGNVSVIESPVETGAPQMGPFDVIIVEGAVDAVPETLFAQLSEGGRIVALLRSGATAIAHLYVKSGTEVAGRAEFNASLPPLQPQKRADSFVF